MDPKKSKLWSFKSISRQQPTFSSEKVPSFNITRFEHTSVSTSSLISSPSSFYSGSVQYGGAMSASRNNLALPYIVPKVTQIRKRMKKMSTDGSESSEITSEETTFTGALSSTARKIFQTLEKMSTPLRDFKKLPPSNRMIPLNVFAKPRRKRMASTDSSVNNKKHCPPDKGRGSHGRITTTTRVSIPSGNSLANKSLTQEFPPSAVDVSKSPPSLYKGKPAVVASFSSSKNILSHFKSGGGKMRNQRKTMHYSNIIQNDDKEENDSLLESTVPMAMDSLPSFNFNGRSNTSTPAAPKPVKKTSTTSGDPCYTFASPAMVKSPSKLTNASRNTNFMKFQFGSPFNPSKSSQAKAMSEDQSHQQSSIGTAKSRPAPHPASTLKTGSVMELLSNACAMDVVEPPKKVTVVSKPSLDELFRKSNNQWECEVCMIMNDNSVSKCVACESPQPVSDPVIPPNKASSNVTSWKCGVCSEINEGNKITCHRCNAAKPSLISAEKTENKWKCTTCLVSNDNDCVKCAACDALKPGSVASMSTQSSNILKDNVSSFSSTTLDKNYSFGFGFPKAATTSSTGTALDKKKSSIVGTDNKQVFFGKSTSMSSQVIAPVKSLSSEKIGDKWTCNVCLISNDQERIKCEACENPKPGSESVSVKSVNSSFGFGLNQTEPVVQWQCNICLVFNDGNQATCVACENPKGGTNNGGSNIRNTFSNSAFKFGSTSTNVYKFGIVSKSTESLQSVEAIPAKSTISELSAVSSTKPAGFPIVSSTVPSLQSAITTPANITASELSAMSSRQPGGFAIESGTVPSLQSAVTTPAKSTASEISGLSSRQLSGFTVESGSVTSLQSVATSLAKSTTSELSALSSQPPGGFPTESSIVDNEVFKSSPTTKFAESVTGVNPKAPLSLFGNVSAVDTSSTTNLAPPSFQFGSNDQTVQTYATQAGTNSIITTHFSSNAVTPYASQNKGFNPVLASQSTVPSKTPVTSISPQNPTHVTTTTASIVSQDNTALFPLQQNVTIPATVQSNTKQPAGFNFSSEVSKTVALPSFNFGSKSASESLPATSTLFGSNVAKSTPATSTLFGSNVAKTTPGFTFGTPSNATVAVAVPQSKPIFPGFGQNSNTLNQVPSQQQQSTPPTFSFGSSCASGFSNPSAANSQTGFTFGNSTASMSTAETPSLTSVAAPTNVFPFGSSSTNTSGSNQVQKDSLNFGATPSIPKAAFNFGQVTAEPKKSKHGFQFGGSQSNSTTATPAGGFSFGGNNSQTIAKPDSGFKFGSQNQSAFSSNPQATFQFGASSINQQPNESVGFSFNSQAQSFTGFGTSTSNNQTGSAFSIGQSGGNGRASTPSRQIRRATRRLKK